MKLSIITVNFNNKPGLEKTIKSVISQAYSDFEYIIIDVESTDDSIDVILRYEQKISNWTCAPGNTINDVVKETILKAKGEYLLFLNSGNYFVDEYSIFNFVSDVDSKFDIIYGDWMQYQGKGTCVERKYPDILSFYFFAFKSDFLCPATLIKKKVLMQYGSFNESFSIFTNWKFLLEIIFKHQCSYIHKTQCLIYYNIDDISSLLDNKEYINYARMEILKKDFPNFYRYKDVMKMSFHFEHSKLTRWLGDIKRDGKKDFV